MTGLTSIDIAIGMDLTSHTRSELHNENHCDHRCFQEQGAFIDRC